MISLVLNFIRNPRYMYNIDVVGAKTGKKLTRWEIFLNGAVNVICAYSTLIFVFGIATMIAIGIIKQF